MAEELQIAGSGAMAKTRDPLGVALLTLVTLGIYYFVWYYKVNREMADLGRARGTDELGDSPGTSLLAVTLGALIIVPAIISIYNTFQRTKAAARLTGVEPLEGWIALILYLLLSPGMWAYLQVSLNNVWEQEAEPLPGQPGPPPPADAMPPRLPEDQ